MDHLKYIIYIYERHVYKVYTYMSKISRHGFILAVKKLLVRNTTYTPTYTLLNLEKILLKRYL